MRPDVHDAPLPHGRRPEGARRPPATAVPARRSGAQVVAADAKGNRYQEGKRVKQVTQPGLSYANSP